MDKKIKAVFVLLNLIIVPMAVAQQTVNTNTEFPTQQQVINNQNSQNSQQRWVQANTNPDQTGSSTAYSAKDYQLQTATPPSNLNTQSGVIDSQNTINGMAPLPPPNLKTQEQIDFEEASRAISPFDNNQLKKLKNKLDQTRRGTAYKAIRTVPRITSISVDLSPGGALPILRTLPGESATIVLLDSTGAPWPLAASPRISDPRLYSVEWLENSSSVVISALTQYDEANLTVFLRGLATPVIVKLSSGEPDSFDSNRVVDYRLDLRVPGRGPNAKDNLFKTGQIALYDAVMQSFLDGIPPEDAKKIEVKDSVYPSRASIWEFNNDIYVRTQYEIQTAFDQSLSSADGTKVYRLPKTPYVTLSVLGKYVMLSLDL